MDAYLESLAIMADAIRHAGKYHLVKTLRMLIDNERTRGEYDPRLHTLAVIIQWVSEKRTPEDYDLLELMSVTARNYKSTATDPFTESRQDELGVLNWLPESASDE